MGPAVSIAVVMLILGGCVAVWLALNSKKDKTK